MHIHIMKIYRESFGHVWHHALEWFRVAFAPTVVYLIGLFILLCSYAIGGMGMTDAIMGQYGFMGPDGAGESANAGFLAGLGSIIYFIMNIIASYTIMVNGFRYGVFNEGGDHWWTLPLNMRFVKMFLYAILIGFLAILYFSIAGGITLGAHVLFESMTLNAILGIFFGIYGLYLLFRIGLTFLLVAVDQSKPIRTSWCLLRGNVWRLIWLTLFIAITIGVITGIGVGILGLLGMLFTMIIMPLGVLTGTLGVLAAILMVLFGVFMWIFYWATFSKAYAFVYQTLTEGEA